MGVSAIWEVPSKEKHLKIMQVGDFSMGKPLVWGATSVRFSSISVEHCWLQPHRSFEISGSYPHS